MAMRPAPHFVVARMK